MRIQVATHADGVGGTPRNLYWDVRRVGIVDIVDQWYGPDYRYVKVQGDDGGVYILRFEVHSDWALMMSVSARGQALNQPLATQAA